MPLTSLPNEILQTIADNLEADSEINQFILISREIYPRLNDWFYSRNIRQGGWALFDAAYNGRVDTAKRLLRLRADANAKGTHHDSLHSPVRTVLGIAAWSEHYEIVKLLVEAADPELVFEPVPLVAEVVPDETETELELMLVDVAWLLATVALVAAIFDDAEETRSE
jgi:hypothetical protein